jgi:hypothetical protein
VRWKNIPGAKNGNTLVSFDYINAQLSTGNMDDSLLNFKHTAIIINDNFDHPVYVDFPITGLVSVFLLKARNILIIFVALTFSYRLHIHVTDLG